MLIFLLSITAFFAAILQAATGIGFGLIGVSVFIVLLGSNSAIQIVIMLTLVMSLLQLIKIYKVAPINTIKNIILGSLIGYPIGIAAFQYVNLTTLKLSVAVLILWIIGKTLHSEYLARQSTSSQKNTTSLFQSLSTGTASGIMTCALAMPGPLVSAYLTRCQLDKDQIRAGVITCSTFSYAIAFLLQLNVIGIDIPTFTTTLILLPSTLIGAIFGHYLANFMSQSHFKHLTLTVLFFSAVNLLIHI